MTLTSADQKSTLMCKVNVFPKKSTISKKSKKQREIKENCESFSRSTFQGKSTFSVLLLISRKKERKKERITGISSGEEAKRMNLSSYHVFEATKSRKNSTKTDSYEGILAYPGK